MTQVLAYIEDLRGEPERTTKQGRFIDLDGADLGDRAVLVERFQREPLPNASIGVAANLDFETLGTNAGASSTTLASGGGVLLTTFTASTSSVIITPHLATGQTAWALTKWRTSQKPRWECAIKTGPAITAAAFWAGLKLTNTPVVVTDADQAFFRYEASVNSGRLQAVYSIGGTDYAVDTGVTIALSTAYRLAIEIDADRVPRFYVDGVLVKVGSALTTAIDLIPYVGVLTPTGSAAARSITLRHMAISKDYA